MLSRSAGSGLLTGKYQWWNNLCSKYGQTCYRRQGLFLKHNEIYLTNLQLDYRGFLENKTPTFSHELQPLCNTSFSLVCEFTVGYHSLLKIISWAVYSAAEIQFCYSFPVATNFNLILWSCRQRFLCWSSWCPVMEGIGRKRNRISSWLVLLIHFHFLCVGDMGGGNQLRLPWL